MSSSALYYKDSKGNIIPVGFDPTGDSAELGDSIKAIIAAHEEFNITPTENTFPPIHNPSISTTTTVSSAERIGVAPERRDNTQVASLRDVTKIQKQETQRMRVDLWLFRDADQSESTASQGSQQGSTSNEEMLPVFNSASEHINLEEALRSARPTDRAGQHTEKAASGIPVVTPDTTPPATSDGKVRETIDLKPIYSAYEMAHEAEVPSEDQSPGRRMPKRLDSTSVGNAVIYQRKVAEFDEQSIAATVGSKKTIDSIYDGTSVKDLSLEEQHKGRHRGATLGDKVRSLIPRRSNSKLGIKKKDASPTDSPAEEKLAESNHKRALSTTSLMPPENESTSDYTYNNPTDTKGYLTTNGRRSSEIPETSSTANTFTRLRRSFSKGEKRKSFTENGSTPNIIGLMMREGGPPVSTALVSPLHEHGGFEDATSRPAVDIEKDDDEDDDDYGGDSDSNAEERIKGGREDLSIDTVAITPDFEGFKEHLLRLNPDMAPFLADRIAHEQIRRFKELKGYKIRHVQDVHMNRCGSGTHCSALGGQPTYLPARSNNKGEKTQIFFMKGHPDTDQSGVTPTNFQYGIPEPPVSRLPATFECSLCFKERKGMNKPSDWTKHVHEDLQPFTCTFSMCATEKKSFKRKADWVRHENECHRHLDEWRCSYPECQHVCYRSDNFSQHLIREHKVPDFKNKKRGSISSKIRAQPISQYGQEEELIANLHRTCRAASSAKPDSEPCVFCGLVSPNWKKHQVHLGKHMETIALPVLGLVEREEVSPDTTISPIKREPLMHTMRSNTISDVMSATDTHSLTPLSTNGSGFHRVSSASHSPLECLLGPQTDVQFPPYLMDPVSYHAEVGAGQSSMGASVFAPQQTSNPTDDGPYEQLGYNPHQAAYLEPFHQVDGGLQRDIAPLYDDHHQVQSFIHVNHNAATSYPSTNVQRSPGQTQLHPQMVFQGADQLPSHDYSNSPHSGASYHHSTTPSPSQPQAFPVAHQLNIPRSEPTVGPLPAYATGDYGNTFGYTDQHAPYASPLEAGQYAHDFHASIEEQEFNAFTSSMGYSATTATTLPVDDTIYDAQQYGVYAPHMLAPHSQTYQYR